MFMYRFLSIKSELTLLGCNEGEVIFLGCVKISWTDPPVCVCAECPPWVAEIVLFEFVLLHDY